MAKRFCRYCDNPFVGDYQAGIADHTESDCLDNIDDWVEKGLFGVADLSYGNWPGVESDYPDLSDAAILSSVRRVLSRRKQAAL